MIDKTLKQLNIEELIAQYQFNDVPKDILLVVHNGFDVTAKCLDTIYEHTDQFDLYVWDNGSREPTKSLLSCYSEKTNFHLYRSEENLGFLVPNNELARKSTAAYLILLNSDCEVKAGWDTALLGYLAAHPQVALVSYQGGLLNEEGLGVQPHIGPEIDYCMGWALAIPRHIYERFGLFDDKNLHFAYGEDADLSLRVKEAGFQIYSMTLNLILHHGNRTTREVRKKRSIRDEFIGNHDYIKERFRHYLQDQRVLLRYPELEKEIQEKCLEIYEKMVISARDLASKSLDYSEHGLPKACSDTVHDSRTNPPSELRLDNVPPIQSP